MSQTIDLKLDWDKKIGQKNEMQGISRRNVLRHFSTALRSTSKVESITPPKKEYVATLDDLAQFRFMAEDSGYLRHCSTNTVEPKTSDGETAHQTFWVRPFTIRNDWKTIETMPESVTKLFINGTDIVIRKLKTAFLFVVGIFIGNSTKSSDFRLSETFNIIGGGLVCKFTIDDAESDQSGRNLVGSSGTGADGGHGNHGNHGGHGGHGGHDDISPYSVRQRLSGGTPTKATSSGIEMQVRSQGECCPSPIDLSEQDLVGGRWWQNETLVGDEIWNNTQATTPHSPKGHTRRLSIGAA